MNNSKTNIQDGVFQNPLQLIPAIIQDDKTLKVLMLGYMNLESWEKSLKTGLVTFFSRSKQRLWIKGESSGNFLQIVSYEADCDNDTILIRVNPAGVVCHTGSVSCFQGRDSEGFLGKLNDVIRKRHEEMPEGSYTTKLFEAGVERISKKVGEESAETIIEAIKGDKKRLVYETADLIYHLMVLLENFNLSFTDIEDELFSRMK
ncbi:MAG: bifunctional phosphoribosyl-AMP cyclohydrolase/phosphoribosyl-ATP diphosphatase [Bacteroidetes bacterium HGW-Bacteroidetes-7]|jgi:phosphoribosyl-ATP pyrophosphohydrolase/phosphoribosyl-AMP cyclohydrolase|nr:MAG: bifunctional phosphoribosyl-AMP cyclohydrolase/phosphoribosyl-ATP diphosphatase [Bacteroidetes bacterium HGW-Bacteroidetes-7]